MHRRVSFPSLPYLMANIDRFWEPDYVPSESVSLLLWSSFARDSAAELFRSSRTSFTLVRRRRVLARRPFRFEIMLVPRCYSSFRRHSLTCLVWLRRSIYSSTSEAKSRNVSLVSLPSSSELSCELKLISSSPFTLLGRKWLHCAYLIDVITSRFRCRPSFSQVSTGSMRFSLL